MKLKKQFEVPTKDFQKAEMVELLVETSPDNFEDLQYGQDIIYKVKIPDFIFNELKDSEPRFATKTDVYHSTPISGCFVELINSPYNRKFQKTQSAYSIGSLQRYIRELTSILNDKYSDNVLAKNKKIFIKYSHDFNNERNKSNFASLGKSVSNRFQYFIGYEIIYNTESDSYKNSLTPKAKEYVTDYICKVHDLEISKNSCLHIYEKYTKFEAEYNIIDWSEEREEFCLKIQNAFIKINNELDNFLQNLDNNTFDKLMLSNDLKLLSK